MDRCTRFCKVYPLYKIDSNEVIKKFEEWISDNGMPSTLITDQGRQYMSLVFRRWAGTCEIKHTPTSVYSPQSNGMAERINMPITNILRIHKGKKLSAALKKVHRFLNYGRNRITGLSPEEMKRDKSKFDILERKLGVDHEEVFNRSNTLSLKRNNEENKNRVEFSFKRGDLVFVKAPFKTKMDSRMNGPYTVEATSINGCNVLVNQGNYRCWQNIRNLKPFLKRGGRDVVSYTLFK